MTDRNRDADPDSWDESVRAAVARELDVRSRRGRPALRTAAVATFAFGMGALAATAVLTIRESAPKNPILASGSLAPGAVEAAARPVQAPRAAEVASASASEDEPVPAVAVGPDDALPMRLIRDVTVEPNLDPSALPQDRNLVIGRAVDPAREARLSNVEPAPEQWAADRQDVGMAPRPALQPSHNTPAEEVPAPAQTDPMLEAPPELEPAASESASARVTSAVSMRSGPDRGTAAVGVVPADAPVQVVACDGWCEIVYNGQRGFIYKTFLDGAP
jgi:Bacterial SH3 domain